MGEPSIFEKIRARNRMMEAVGTEPAPPPVAPPKPKSTKRVRHCILCKEPGLRVMGERGEASEEAWPPPKEEGR